jgi:hypothetical protein
VHCCHASATSSWLALRSLTIWVIPTCRQKEDPCEKEQAFGATVGRGTSFGHEMSGPDFAKQLLLDGEEEEEAPDSSSYKD